jgi:hypothetical protein
MDTLTRSTTWPARPYLGLNFYREPDALLFRERDKEVTECMNLLLGFQLKILLLHGSSGSGKSSFLRAGLIPALKQAAARPSFFLATDEHVIRCTDDPILELARVLIGSLSCNSIFTQTAWSEDASEYTELIDDELRRSLHDNLLKVT